MGFFLLFLAKLAGIVKVISVKKCGVEAAGVKNSVKVGFIRSVVCVLISAIVFLFSFEYMDPLGVGISSFSGICSAVSLFVWILAAERVSICLLEVFCMVGSLVIPMILAPYLYAGEFILWYQWIGVGLLIISVFFFVDKKKSIEKRERLTWGTLALLLANTVSTAGAMITQKYYITYSCGNIAGFNLITFVVMALLFLLACVAFRCRQDAETDTNQGKGFAKKIYVLIIIAATMLYGNQLFSLQAVKYFTSGVFYPLSYAIGWPLTFAADVLVFKEKASIKKLLGLCIIIIASILTCL